MRRLTIALTLAAYPLAAQEHVHPAGDVEKVGSVAFQVSCAPATQLPFNRAVAMLHSFWFEAAEQAFSEIASTDSACAMAYWGHAMTLMGNPIARFSPPPPRLAAGLELSLRARELAQRASHREQMYADAVLAFYRDHDKLDHQSRMDAHERALEALHKMHPEDMEATIFYGRAVVANAPPTDLTFAKLLAGAKLLEPLFEQHPEHPGIAHYVIHAYDVPPLAKHGVKAARLYAQIAPSAPHALHMPSHTFTRLGYWDESIETNARSARAEPDSNAAVHPMDYMVYAFLQQGRDRDAKGVVDRAVQNSDRFYGGLLGYNFAAMPARYALERDSWAGAAKLRIPPGGAPYVRAITHFARAVGAARSGSVAAAKVDLDSLASLKRQLDAAKDPYWANVVEAQRLAAAAWVAFAEKNNDEALRLARAGADLEQTFEKHAVTPGPILPARELEGDLLMQLGRFADASRAYEKTLESEPRRKRAVFGAARAAERAGNAELARARYSELLEIMASADPDRPEPAVARRYIASR